MAANLTSEEYEKTKFVLPVGIGFKHTINENWALNTTFSKRITVTDYIDDFAILSTDKDDVYYILNVNVIYKF